jgi:diphthamide biosynthesis enzyme Dph1/Dph2-like protein
LILLSFLFFFSLWLLAASSSFSASISYFFAGVSTLIFALPTAANCPQRYDPYGKVLTRERYGVDTMKQARRRAIDQAARSETWGLVLGTLGRQGNPAILGHLRRSLKAQGRKCVLVLLSEVKAFGCFPFLSCYFYPFSRSHARLASHRP